MVLQEIGKTAEGRPQLMAIVTSPANHRNLAKYVTSRGGWRLPRASADEEARRAASEGKAVVWIDGGLHATETLGAQQLAEMVYQMVSRTDDETMRFLDECIILFVHANPDGNDLVADWYMRNPDPTEAHAAGLPRLYQKYIGHDNNRDFFASTQAETENINRVLYHDWLPQILYNHHQSGPAGTVVWSSPQRDPYNYNLDPLLILGLQALGTHMHQRLAAEGKPGATMASGGAYDGWWNGGIRNTGNFHNIIAILTETIGSPTPMRIPLVLAATDPEPRSALSDRAAGVALQAVDRLFGLVQPRGDRLRGAQPRAPALQHLHDGAAVDRARQQDTWTPSPTRLRLAAERTGGSGRRRDARAGRRGLGGAAQARRLRDPRGYIIPSDQPDFPTAMKFVNALREVNVDGAPRDARIRRRRQDVSRGLVRRLTAQAFRPHVIDMFEPQDHPNVIPYPGAPPTPPYDNAGWTLAFQMGVEFDRILEPFTGPFEHVTDWNVEPPPGRVTAAAGTTVYRIGRRVNDAYRAVNRLLAERATVTATADAFYVAASAGTAATLQKLAAELGVDAQGLAGSVAAAHAVRAPRIGLWDQYGGSIESGWTRWILEQFEFPFERVFAPRLDAGNLNAAVRRARSFANGGIPAASAGGRGGRGAGRGGGAGASDALSEIPQEYRAQLGRVTTDAHAAPAATVHRRRRHRHRDRRLRGESRGAPQAPVENHLVENGTPLPRAKYFVPGSVLSAKVDVTEPIAAGMNERTDFFFDNSPVFRLGPGAAAAGVRAIATFDSPAPLRSGWAWGQQYLDGGVIAIDAPFGKGRVVLFGPEILQRAQPHGTFKLLFNGLLASSAR